MNGVFDLLRSSVSICNYRELASSVEMILVFQRGLNTPVHSLEVISIPQCYRAVFAVVHVECQCVMFPTRKDNTASSFYVTWLEDFCLAYDLYLLCSLLS